MANRCFTSINVHANKDALERIYDNLKTATATDQWLGALLLHLGQTQDEIERGEICVRGYIDYLERYPGSRIVIDTDTAWTPCLKVFTTFLDHYAKGEYRLEYITEEMGCDIYCTNMDYADVYFDNYGDEHIGPLKPNETRYLDQDYALELLQEITGETEGSLEELAVIAEDKYEDLRVMVAEYAAVEDWQ